MSPQTMNYIYFISIALFGLFMVISPQTFLGKAKFDEGAIKTQGLIKKGGVAIIVFCVLLILYYAFFK